MISIPPKVAEIIIAGLSAEISCQEAIGSSCGDDWPPDYDPNDVSIYYGFKEWLLEHSGRVAVFDGNPRSKPASFVFSLIPHIVKENLSRLSTSDIDASYCVFAQFVTMRARQMLESHSETSSERRHVMWLLDQVISFPGC